MVIIGVSLLVITMLSLARRKMTDSFTLTWGLISVIFILGGVFLHPAELNRYISAMGMLLVAAIGFCMLFGAYFMSLRVSELMRRNQELSMQVTLLRHEVEALEARGVPLAHEDAGEEEPPHEEDSVCHQYAGMRRG